MFTVWAPLALVVAYRYVGRLPPRVMRIAAGAENGAYYAFAQQYGRLLAADGITLEVIPTANIPPRDTRLVATAASLPD